jgi:hypothetical protein
MARPIKTPAEALTKTARFRVTEAELSEQLPANAAAAGFASVSDFCRARTLNAAPRRPKVTPERQALIKGLGLLGNIRADINRLVKDRHAHLFVKPEEAEAALTALTILADKIHSELSGDGD